MDKTLVSHDTRNVSVTMQLQSFARFYCATLFQGSLPYIPNNSQDPTKTE